MHHRHQLPQPVDLQSRRHVVVGHHLGVLHRCNGHACARFLHFDDACADTHALVRQRLLLVNRRLPYLFVLLSVGF